MAIKRSALTRWGLGAIAALGLLAAGCGVQTTAGGAAIKPAAPAVSKPVEVQANKPPVEVQANKPIEVQMGDFFYGPQAIQLRAGQPVTLTFTNRGAIKHEVMIGKHAREAGGYETDFFHDLQVQATGSTYEWNPEGHAEGQSAAQARDEHQEAKDEHQEAKDEHGQAAEAGQHNVGHSGAALEVEPGGKATLTFTVSADKKGTWEIGCFVPGHYQAGMKGTLIVE